MKKILIVCIMLAMTSALVACGEKSNDISGSEIAAVEETKGSFGDLTSMPQFKLDDINDQSVTDEVLKENAITVINIWGTFCKPCIDELPILQELSKEYESKWVGIIGIIADGDVNNVGAFEILSKSKVEYINLVPNEQFKKDFLNKVKAVPVTVVVDSSGKILETVVGDKTKSEYTDIIETYLNEVE